MEGPHAGDRRLSGDDPSTLPKAHQVVLFGDRRGLARIMQLKTIDRARRTGCDRLKSRTATSKVPMLELYAPLGYRTLYVWSRYMMEL